MAKGKKNAAKTPEGPLDSSPSHLLHRVLQIALDVYAEETGPGAVTQRQFAVLTAVSRNEGLTQTDLVRATGIDRSTLADMVARMIGKGLLERERSNTDARANTVRLTDKGRQELEAARPKVEAADKRILSLLPGGKREGFLTVLLTMARAGEAARIEEQPAAAKVLAEDEAQAKKKGKKAAKLARAGKEPKPPKPEKKKKKAKKAKKADEPESGAPPVTP